MSTKQNQIKILNSSILKKESMKLNQNQLKDELNQIKNKFYFIKYALFKYLIENENI
jgi:hypothetical protein